MNVNNKSLDEYVAGSHASVFKPRVNSCLTDCFRNFQDTNALGIKITDRTCLIMDEVDGMSAGDRGGVGALNAMIKKSKVSVDH